MKKRKKNAIDKVNFIGRHNSMAGILFTVLAVLNIISLLTISILLSKDIINDNFLVGLYGLIILLLSGFGFYKSYKSTKEQDIFYKFPIMGMVLNGLVFIFLISLYLIGIVI